MERTTSGRERTYTLDRIERQKIAETGVQGQMAMAFTSFDESSGKFIIAYTDMPTGDFLSNNLEALAQSAGVPIRDSTSSQDSQSPGV